MKISAGNYYLNTDKHGNVWITEKRIVQEGKNVGEETEVRVSGYCNTFKQAYYSMLDKEIFKSDATTVEQACKDIQNAYGRVLQLFRSIAGELK